MVGITADDVAEEIPNTLVRRNKIRSRRPGLKPAYILPVSEEKKTINPRPMVIKNNRDGLESHIAAVLIPVADIAAVG
jgi:transcription initiation factor TFIID subunit TAF12